MSPYVTDASQQSKVPFRRAARAIHLCEAGESFHRQTGALFAARRGAECLCLRAARGGPDVYGSALESPICLSTALPLACQRLCRWPASSPRPVCGTGAAPAIGGCSRHGKPCSHAVAHPLAPAAPGRAHGDGAAAAAQTCDQAGSDFFPESSKTLTNLLPYCN